MKKMMYYIWAIFLPQISYAAITAPTGTGLPTGTISSMIVKATNFFLGFLAVLAILMIVVSGIMYIASGGESGKVDKAKEWLTYSIVGLVVALLAYVIVNAVGKAFGGW